MSLAAPWAFGMDYPGRKLTFYDQGETNINAIILPQSGRAVANLLSPPLESATGPSLSGFKNRLVYTASFCRFAEGQKQLAEGDAAWFGKMLYARVFFPDGSGNHETRRGLHNEVLGHEQENLDDFTKIAITKVESGSTYP
ncbi:hypothetical protein PFICI_09055 [Pestalotiopsis fici W106-1]|uniref:Uncharacterized protein n=1 Tax=Pestalotiopsis fici (strain W106-1 / CGMCC3.15140) TaxID=1229662 RepID=W3X1D7_PESFW|nr:uncharacterized protein PFICI_09055 [Pestalotiopsis fici W106-1]ETS79202.1 hypothetical protein PFICI_09055 [Pestalotiopsis fici W106-1]